MTKAAVQAQINHGKALLAAGDLANASQALSQASAYLHAFAAAGASKSTVKTLGKNLNKAIANLHRALVQSGADSEALVAPSYAPAGPAYGRDALVAPSYAPPIVHTQGNDALIQPSFHGAAPGGFFSRGVFADGIAPPLGFALATLGLVLGIGTLYKAWK